MSAKARSGKKSVKGKDQSSDLEEMTALCNSYKELAELSHYGITVINKNSEIEYMNSAMETCLGLKASQFNTVDEWIKLSFPDENDQEEVRKLWAEDLRARKPRERIMELSPEGVTPRLCRFRIVKMTGQKIFVTGEDITEQHETQLALSQAQFSVDRAADAVYWISPDATFSYVNDTACEMLGYSREELLKLTVHDIDLFFPPKAWVPHWEYLQKKGSLTLETMHKKKDGSTVPVEVSANFQEFMGKEYNFAFARDISARKAADKELLESEASFHDLANAAFEAIIVHDHGLLMKANKQFYTMFGYTQKDLIDEDVISHIIAPAYRKEVNRRIEEGNSEFYEAMGVRKGDIEFPIEVRVREMDFEGRHVRVAAILDVSARKEMEETLRQSEERYRHIVEASPMGMFMYRLDEDGELLLEGANPAADRILGIENSRLFGRTIEKAFPQLAGTDVPERYKEVAKKGGQWYAEDIQYEGEGISGAYEVYAFQSLPGHMVASFLDITERKKAEFELKRLAAAVEGAAESIVITDGKGVIIYVNPWFEKMTGYTRDEILGQHTRMLGSGKHDDEFYQGLWGTLTSGQTWSGHFINKKKDESLFEEDAVISPVMNRDGDIVNYVCVKRDVTQEILLEHQVRQSQKMAAIGQLAHRIAHSFTNVLVMILGNAQLAKTMVEPESEVDKYLNEVVDAANRVSMLTSELLSFAHPAELKLKNMRLDKSLLGIDDILTETLAPRVKLDLDISEATMRVKVDPRQLEQALLHLAINADEAITSPGGLLTIKAGASDFGKDFAMITVGNNGPRISPELKKQMFEPFFTTKSTTKNAGLGLATVYSIISQHGGFIDVESPEAGGALFKLYLPIENKKSKT